MCIGVPMVVEDMRIGTALCRGPDGARIIDMMLVGDQPPGTHVLCFLDTAREVLSAEDAARIGDAIAALKIALTGGTDFDHLFADLIGREPELPDFLKPASDQPSHANPTPIRSAP